PPEFTYPARLTRSLILQVLGWWIVARVNRIGQERFLVVGPKLGDSGIGLDEGIHQLAILPLAPADEDVTDHIADMIELYGATPSVGERHRVQGFGELLAVVDLAATRRNRGLDALAGHVHAGRIATRQHIVLLRHRRHEPLVAF